VPNREIPGCSRRLPVVAVRPRRVDGHQPFREFRKNLGVAKNIQTVRLRGALTGQGILKTQPADDGSP
jgi:hypothetical protein